MHTHRESTRTGLVGKVNVGRGLPHRNHNGGLKLTLLTLLALVGISGIGGCGELRFAPGELQKQNVYLHHKTVQAAALKAHQEQSSATLQGLTGQATQQSESIVAYYGLPKEIPTTRTVGEILSEENATLTTNARVLAMQRPDPWDVADHLLEMGIALAGVLGGVYGAKAAAALKTTRQKSTALREVVRGNEIFKNGNPAFTEDFKQAQADQSETTRQLVAQMK